mmetsp:Transcript_53463/g.116551  ORF Transcript_53463/g.116551 Transcript_53463/m.116551 type:complete len:228 (+) Transcript_53463:1224-1907(+)
MSSTTLSTAAASASLGCCACAARRSSTSRLCAQARSARRWGSSTRARATRCCSRRRGRTPRSDWRACPCHRQSSSAPSRRKRAQNRRHWTLRLQGLCSKTRASLFVSIALLASSLSAAWANSTWRCLRSVCLQSGTSRSPWAQCVLRTERALPFPWTFRPFTRSGQLLAARLRCRLHFRRSMAGRNSCNSDSPCSNSEGARRQSILSEGWTLRGGWSFAFQRGCRAF